MGKKDILKSLDKRIDYYKELLEYAKDFEEKVLIKLYEKVICELEDLRKEITSI